MSTPHACLPWCFLPHFFFKSRKRWNFFFPFFSFLTGGVGTNFLLLVPTFKNFSVFDPHLWGTFYKKRQYPPLTFNFLLLVPTFKNFSVFDPHLWGTFYRKRQCPPLTFNFLLLDPTFKTFLVLDPHLWGTFYKQQGPPLTFFQHFGYFG